MALAQIAAGPAEDGPSALHDMRDSRLPKPLLDPGKILSGGPPPDGIPAIDRPRFSRAGVVDWIAGTEPLLSLTVGGETRGYPLQIMVWHEIVNDTVGGIPVAVTYCPLCNSGVAFDRRAARRVLSFGTSGRLYANNLVMYDRQTESLWPQLTGQAALGRLTGTTLRAFPIGTLAWSEFRASHPDAWVLTRDTGYRRPYGRNPYAGYDDPAGQPLFELPSSDARLPPKERVIGVSGSDESIAVVRSTIARRAVLEVTVDGNPLVMWHRPGQVSALDDDQVARGRDIGTVEVFDPFVAGRHLHFVADGTGFRDRESGSRWDVLGRAVGRPLAGRQLEPVRYLDTFWFAWVTFHPETRVIR
ncbi:MAG: DUF3179 domain-containing protein [Catenulispora sp.]|nr:DUF3179 domain-containing protein [Catenulispora sp.]